MGRRLDLHNLLIETLGSANVYFQPPPSNQIAYPCIVYSYVGNNTVFADDAPYSITKEYQVTVIDRNPDSVIPDNIAKLKQCSLSRTYVTDNLNHYVFSLFY